VVHRCMHPDGGVRCAAHPVQRVHVQDPFGVDGVTVEWLQAETGFDTGEMDEHLMELCIDPSGAHR